MIRVHVCSTRNYKWISNLKTENKERLDHRTIIPFSLPLFYTKLIKMLTKSYDMTMKQLYDRFIRIILC